MSEHPDKDSAHSSQSSVDKLIAKHNDSRNQTSDEIPQEPEENHLYCKIGTTIPDVRKILDKDWIQKSGASSKLFTASGKTVHKIDDKLVWKQRKGKKWEVHDVDMENVYRVVFHYSYKELPSGNQFWRRLTQIKKLDEEFTTVICEFYERAQEELENRKRKREKRKEKNGTDSANQIPTSSQDSTLSGSSQIPDMNVIEHKTSGIAIRSRSQTPDSQYSSSSDCEESSSGLNFYLNQEDAHNLSNIDEFLHAIDAFDSLLHTKQEGKEAMLVSCDSKTLEDNTLSYDGDRKKACHSGDIGNSSEPKAPVVYINYSDVRKDTISKMDGKYIDGYEYLGPVKILNSEGNFYFISKDYESAKDSEWRRLKNSPKIVTKLWSCPYVVQSNTSKVPFIMFTLENYSDKQFIIRMKLLDCDLNRRVEVPCKFHVEVKVKKDSKSDEYSDPVSKWFVCKEKGEYSLELLVPFPDGPVGDFPGLWIKAIDFVENL